MDDRQFGVPATFAAVIAVMLILAYCYGPYFTGAPPPQEVPIEETKLVRIPLEEAFNISSQIVQLFISISFGLFVLIGYALSRDQRNMRSFSVIDFLAGCAFLILTFIFFYFVYQLRYGQYAAIQHPYTEDGLRQTIAWFNEVHAKLALCIAASAIPALFIVARVLFVGQAPVVHECTPENQQQKDVQKISASPPLRFEETTNKIPPQQKRDVSEENSK